MSRVQGNGRVAVALLIVVAAGCSSQLISLNRQTASPDKKRSDWAATGWDLSGHQAGFFSIEYGPTVTDASQTRLVAGIRVPCSPMSWRVERLLSEPSVSIWGDFGVELFSQVLPRSTGCVRFAEEGRVCLFTTGTGILEWNADNQTVRNVFPSAESPESISRDCRLVAVEEYEDSRTQLRVLRIADGLELGAVELHGMSCCEQFVDEDNRLALVLHNLDDSRIDAMVWDYRTGQTTPMISTRWFRGAFTADGTRYAAEHDGYTIRVWDTDRGVELFTTGSHSGDVWTCAFSPDGRYLASAGEGKARRGDDTGRGEIRIWDAETGAAVTTITDNSSWGVTALAFSPDGTELASGNGSGKVRFWRVPD